MVSITSPAGDPTHVVVTATVTLYLDRLLVDTLSSELEKSVREAAVRELENNQEVKLAVFKAAKAKLLAMLEVETKETA